MVIVNDTPINKPINNNNICDPLIISGALFFIMELVKHPAGGVNSIVIENNEVISTVYNLGAEKISYTRDSRENFDKFKPSVTGGGENTVNYTKFLIIAIILCILLIYDWTIRHYPVYNYNPIAHIRRWANNTRI